MNKNISPILLVLFFIAGCRSLPEIPEKFQRALKNAFELSNQLYKDSLSTFYKIELDDIGHFVRFERIKSYESKFIEMVNTKYEYKTKGWYDRFPLADSLIAIRDTTDITYIDNHREMYVFLINDYDLKIGLNLYNPDGSPFIIINCLFDENYSVIASSFSRAYGL